MRTPLTLITGPLGSGKTTLLRHILQSSPERIALLINEFGELGIDGRILKGREVEMVELEGGCVCCSLMGEFEAALEEIIDRLAPERIVVETTGVAEPDALVFTLEEELAERIRLDGVVTVADADALVRFPSPGRTLRAQAEAADLILLNKADLVAADQLQRARELLQGFNGTAGLLPTDHGRVDPEVLFGLGGRPRVAPAGHVHQEHVQTFAFRAGQPLDRHCFEILAGELGEAIYRAKGLVCFRDESCLFNFVAGRWELEPFEAGQTELVFIGPDAATAREPVLKMLQACQARE